MAAKDFVLDTVTAPVAVRVRGAGQGIVLVPGGLQTAADFDKLASFLARDFKTIVLDRRGRGDSRCLQPLGGLEAEAQDVLAVGKAFDARFLFGLSSGALIALNAAEIASDAFDAVVLYEPPLATPEFLNDFDWIDEMGSLLSSGRDIDALTRMIEVIGDHPIVRSLPRSVLRFAASFALRFGKSANGDSLSTLLPTFEQDSRVVQDARSLSYGLGVMQPQFLLVNGDRAADPLIGALNTLHQQLPNSERRVLRRVGHLAASNGGRPYAVAMLLRDYFARSSQ